MIQKTILDIPHNQCTGCGACYNKCPCDAIEMKLDDEGFLFPQLNEKCVQCSLCVAVCPVNKPLQFHDTPKAYAVWAADDIRLKSSSGGMFTLLANEVLEQGGVVCGAVYEEDYQTVYHDWAECAEELSPLRGSKYVQSDTRLTYRQTKAYLDKGQAVLYSGCPCQIAGLYNYLGKNYENLYTADLVCHGSNSVTAYQSFLREFCEGKAIEKVDFRDKKFYSWSTPTVVYFKDGTVKKQSWNEGAWYEGFLQGIINRQNCYNCPYARAERISDITMADCWQVHRLNPEYDDRKGTSLVLINSTKGRQLFEKINSKMKLCAEIPLKEIRKYNGQMNHPTAEHPSRKFFFSHLQKYGYHKALWYGKGRRFDFGIVGWWFASNYGSSLTYYALATILEEMGKQVLFIPIPKVDGTPWEKETAQTISFLAKRFKIGRARNFSGMKEFNSFCDAFIVGSDQMWTIDSTKQVGYSFFLDFVNRDKKKIAFATSFGKSKFDGDVELRETAGDYLKRFDAVSVRERSGEALCLNAFGVKAEQIIDPVFLCPKERYEELIADGKISLPKKYLLCYILDPTPQKEQIAITIAKHEGLEIVTVLGMKEYNWAIKKWGTGKVLPKVTTEQFLYCIKNSSYLVTDSHHGVCMGIVFQRKYAALVNTNRGSDRFVTVADSFGLQDRLVWDCATGLVPEVLFKDIDYAKVMQRMEVETMRTRKWLEAAIDKETVVAEETVRTVAAQFHAIEYDLKNELRSYERRIAQLEKQINEEKVKPKNRKKFAKPIKKEILRIWNLAKKVVPYIKKYGWKATLHRIRYKIKKR